MKKFIVNIWAYDHHAKFNVSSLDDPQSLENAILDKLGENVIVWEKTGMFSSLNRITYEEVIKDGTTSAGPLHEEERSRPTMGAGSS